MTTMFMQARNMAFAAVVCTSVCAMTGCLESSFRLASESRLPQGMTVPPGLTRDDVSVTVDFYAYTAKLTLRAKSGKKITKMTGRASNVLYLKSTPRDLSLRYPTYELIKINGVTEIMEQRRPEDILYITDDPAIREKLLAGKGLK